MVYGKKEPHAVYGRKLKGLGSEIELVDAA